jgi:uncharacterized protein YktA (UPF0223 family)
MNKLFLKILVISITLFTFLDANSQRVSDMISTEVSSAIYRNDISLTLKESNIEGSAYIENSFKLAEISGVARQIMIRYNAFSDIIEVKDDENQIFTLFKKKPYQTIKILYPEKTMQLLSYNYDGKEIEGYLYQLSTSKNITTYKQEKIILQQAKEASNSYQVSKPAKYVKLNTLYYLRLGFETSLPMPKNKKELQDLFPSKKEEIATYLKNNSYSLKNEKSIIDMATFLSNL